jgi:hypothetical protein
LKSRLRESANLSMQMISPNVRKGYRSPFEPVTFWQTQLVSLIVGWIPAVVLGVVLGFWASTLGAREHFPDLVLRGVIFALPPVLLALWIPRGWFIPAFLYAMTFRYGYAYWDDFGHALSVFRPYSLAEKAQYEAMIKARNLELQCFLIATALAALVAPKIRALGFFKSIAAEVDEYERMKGPKRRGE